jgi:hypothetical protein
MNPGAASAPGGCPVKITIQHGAGVARTRALGLAEKIRSELGLDVAIRPTRLSSEPHLEVLVDGVTIAWRHGGPLEHSMGLGWPDDARVIETLRGRLEPTA